MRTMLRMLFIVLLLGAAPALQAQEKTATQEQPADKAQPATVTVNVLESKFEHGMCVVKAVIDGQAYWLSGPLYAKNGPLKPGEYKATLIKDEHKVSYKIARTYEFLYPDGKKEKFMLIGIMK